LGQPREHEYCVSCGTRLPGELLPVRAPKVTRWFWSLPIAPGDPDSAALRVTRYLEEIEIATHDGTTLVPSQHVRFSIWVDDRAVCAISIPDDEAEELASFLRAAVPNGESDPQRVRD
jgi:hypothetical protein